MAIMAMTTRSSIRVKANRWFVLTMESSFSRRGPGRDVGGRPASVTGEFRLDAWISSLSLPLLIPTAVPPMAGDPGELSSPRGCPARPAQREAVDPDVAD